MTTALVTGAAGFIGSHLLERLLLEGLTVRCIDNFSSGNQGNIEAAYRQAGVEVAQTLTPVDLADDTDLEEYVDGVDFVFHLAALADIVPSIRDPRSYHRSNVEGTFRLLEAIRNCGSRAKVVYAASSSCYGLADETPTPETAPIRPEYPYALTKTVAEQYVRHWSQVYGFPSVSLRFFNVYGPRARTNGTYGAVFGVFLAQKLSGKPMTIVGDGTQRRDFIYVTDVVDACFKAATSDTSGEIFNVGSGQPQSINRLCELIGGPTTHIPKRPGEPDCTWADISRITRMLGWQPSVSFEQGVATMLHNIQAWASAPVWSPADIASATADWFKHLGKDDPAHVAR